MEKGTSQKNKGVITSDSWMTADVDRHEQPIHGQLRNPLGIINGNYQNQLDSDLAHVDMGQVTPRHAHRPEAWGHGHRYLKILSRRQSSKNK